MQAARMRAGTTAPAIRPGVAALLWPLLLGACTGDAVRTAAPDKPNTGQWKFEQRNDPVSGTQVTTAWLSISRYHFLSAAFHEGELQLMCFKTRPVIRLAFNLRVGSDKTAALAYRFDENPGRYAKAKFFAREKFIVIDDRKEVADFVGQLQSAQSLFLSITRLRAGSFTAKFPVHGAQPAIEAAFAECPVAPEKPRAKTSARSLRTQIQTQVRSILSYLAKRSQDLAESRLIFLKPCASPLIDARSRSQWKAGS